MAITLDGTDGITTPAITNLIRVQTFTSHGTYTPSANTRKIQVFVQGGGGGGGGADSDASGQYGAGGGGGAGALIISDIIAIDPDTYTSTITIGAGGSGGGGPNDGTSGGDSIFDDGTIYLNADSGFGGQAEVDRTGVRIAKGGQGGNYLGTQSIATNHTPLLMAFGEQGVHGFIISGAGSSGGKGGSSYFSGGGASARINTTGAGNGDDGKYGSGGGGAVTGGAQTNQTGGDGGDGVVMIYEYL